MTRYPRIIVANPGLVTSAPAAAQAYLAGVDVQVDDTLPAGTVVWMSDRADSVIPAVVRDWMDTVNLGQFRGAP